MKLTVFLVKEGDECFPNEHRRMTIEGEFSLTMLNDFISNDLPPLDALEWENGEYECTFDLEEETSDFYYEIKSMSSKVIDENA